MSDSTADGIELQPESFLYEEYSDVWAWSDHIQVKVADKRASRPIYKSPVAG